MIRGAVILAFLCCLSGPVRTIAHAADPTLSMLGILDLPASIQAADGSAMRLVGLSGITWLGDDAWAAVLDNNDTMVTFTLELSEAGKPLGVDRLTLKPLAARHDYEDIAPCPPALEARIARRLEKRGQPAPGRCLLICDEDTPAIRGLSLADGRLLGAVPLPPIAKACRANKGLESLAVDPDGTWIWTANEEAFATDGPASSRMAGTLIRLIAIPTPSDATAEGAEPKGRQFAYEVDPPHEMVAVGGGIPLSGVSAIVSLGEGKLLVLERSGGEGLPPFENRVYLVDTTTGQDVSDVQSLSVEKPAPLTKRLLWKDSLGCNVEGLALGPEVKGGRTLVGIADNGHVGGTTPLIFFVLK